MGVTAPDDLPQLAALREDANRLIRERRLAEALQLHIQAAKIAPHDINLLLQHAQLCILLQDLPASRRAFQAAMETASSLPDYQQLFELTAEVFEGWDRNWTWFLLHERVLALAQDNAGIETALLTGRLKLALRDYDGFLALLDRLPPVANQLLHRRLNRVGAMLRADRFPDFGKPKIFGIGLSKTGTTSLTTALNRLGFHAMHFVNSLTREILKIEDAYLCDALTDTPVCMHFETLYRMFPNSKFIYTVRAPEHWAPSFTAHYRHYHGSSGFDGIKDRLSTRGGTARNLERGAIHASLFGAHENALDAYAAFDARVRQFFRQHDPSRLLEMNIAAGDGWSLLCPFIGRPIPDFAFPWKNKSGYTAVD